jgi:anti-sigma28 factor (negative regulator of flagellin synthesis)
MVVTAPWYTEFRFLRVVTDTGRRHHDPAVPTPAAAARRAHAMRKTEYDPIPHASDVPHGHDTPIPPPASASADSEQQHALAVQARAVAQAAPEVRVARVEAARRALQEGTLMLDGPALAEKLLEAVRAERRHA